MRSASGTTLVHTGSHWGLYDAEVEHGRVVGVRPFHKDPYPSRIIDTIPSAVHAPCRIESPMVRQGWLAHGVQSNRAGRGVEPFVAVPWDEVLDLVAAELQRVKSTYGNEAIYASSGWGSAGVFHHAATQLSRFLNGFGGFVRQVTNYSFGAASVIVPHVVGTMEPVGGAVTTWPTIAEHTKLMVLFGGVPAKNTQVNSGGIGRHEAGDWLRQARQAGVAFVNISPLRDDVAEALGAEWLPLRPNTDVALMLGLAHTLIAENLYDRPFLDTYTVGFECLRAYIMGETDGIPKDAAWASDITQIPATDDCHAGATDGGRADDDRRELVGPARRSWRTTVLDGHRARRDAGPDWASGRRLRLRLWRHRRHRQSPPQDATTTIADRCQCRAGVYPNGAVQ